jgi:hypothetical protein
MYNSSITHPASITLKNENHSKTTSYDIHPASIIITRRRQTNKRKKKRKMNKSYNKKKYVLQKMNIL